MREERVFLEDEPHRSLFRHPQHTRPPVEPNLVVERDPSAGRFDQPRDRTQHGRLAGAGWPDQGERLGLDCQRERELERAKVDTDVETEDRHEVITL